jgi:cellulose synthase (UDP-forming)
MGYMEDPKMAFVQTPQYYGNKDRNALTRASWEQQELFFGPICQGKNRMNATFWCGTNAVMRRDAILEVGGVPEANIAEDFLASLFIHQKGWKSLFIPEVLAVGLAPTDLASYWAQQFRWARGSLEVIFKHNPLAKRGLTWAQRWQYLYSAGYYLNGLVVLIDAVVPLFVLLTGMLPVKDATSNFMVYFFPFIFFTLYLLMRSTAYTVTFRAIQLSMSTFFVFILATVSAALGLKSAFKVTSKTEREGNFLFYALPNIIYAAIGLSVVAYAVISHGLTPAVVTNSAWVLFNIIFFASFIQAGYAWHTVPARAAAFVNRAGLIRVFEAVRKPAAMALLIVGEFLKGPWKT